ncbi:MAG TPA: hypothetical protein VIV58_32470 [Kofleriaceae bacterium]
MRLITLGILVTASVASAAPRHVLVLRAEGNADAPTRANVDQQITKLAKTLDGNIEVGEITFTDASAAVGCSGSEAQCRDDVLGMMGVDELVATTVSAMPSGDVRVIVHRIPKGAATKDAQTTVPRGGSIDDKIAAEIGPMFGVKAKPAATPPVSKTPTPPPVVVSSTTVPPPATTPPPTGAFGNDPVTPATGSAASVPPPNSAAPVRTAQVDQNPNTVTAAPNGAVAVDQPRSNRAITGLAIGGGLVVVSIILWAEAGSVQSDINNAPTRTPADFKNLKDLEAKGDAYSGLGNLTFLGGLVVGGISGYFFYKDRKAASSAQARITPTLVDHGVGLAFTYGGLP